MPPGGEVLRPGQETVGMPSGGWRLRCGTGGPWIAVPYCWGHSGAWNLSGPPWEFYPLGIGQGGSGRVVRAARPKDQRNSAPPFLRRKDSRRRHATGAGGAGILWLEHFPGSPSDRGAEGSLSWWREGNRRIGQTLSDQSSMEDCGRRLVGYIQAAGIGETLFPLFGRKRLAQP